MNRRQKEQANDVHQNKSWSKNSCMSLFTCCLKMPGDEYDDDVFQYNAGKYEYVIEKLLIKRVPFAIFATLQGLEERDTNADIQQFRVSNRTKSSLDNEVQTLNDGLRNQLNETNRLSKKTSNGSRWYKHKRSKLTNKKSIALDETLQYLHNSDMDFEKHSTQTRSQQAKMNHEYVVGPMQFNWNRNVVDKLKMKAADNEFEQLFCLHEDNNSSQLDAQDNVHSVTTFLAGNRSDLIHNANSNDIGSTTLKWRITIKHRQPDTSKNKSSKMFPSIDMLRFSRNHDKDN